MISNSQQNNLYALYEDRLKAFMQLNKVIQYNLENDQALTLLKSQEMAKYRNDRILQIIKDAMINQKQRMLIRALTKCQQLQMQLSQWRIQPSYQADKRRQSNTFNSSAKSTSHFLNNFTHNSQVQRDVPVPVSIQVSNSSINSAKMINGAISPKSSGNINIYQKLLQDKIAQIKQYQKKQTSLREQIVSLKKLNSELKMKMQNLTVQIHQSNIMKQNIQFKKHQQKQNTCQKCVDLQQIIKIKTQQIRVLTVQNEKAKDKTKKIEEITNFTKELQSKIKIRQGQSSSRQQQYNKKLQSLKQKIQILIAEHEKQNSNLTAKIKELQQINQKLSQNKSYTNLKLIADLKDQVVRLEGQLLNISNVFDQIKQHFGERLKAQIKKTKRFHDSSKQYIKSSLTLMKQEMQGHLIEGINILQIKYKSRKSKELMTKKLNQMDNQLDYFIENHLISQ